MATKSTSPECYVFTYYIIIGVRVLIWSSAVMRERQHITGVIYYFLLLVLRGYCSMKLVDNLLTMEIACWVYNLLHTHTNPVRPFLCS